jgi:hypothetical protein
MTPARARMVTTGYGSGMFTGTFGGHATTTYRHGPWASAGARYYEEE